MKILPIISIMFVLLLLIGGGHFALFHSIKSVFTLSIVQLKYLAWGLALLSVSFVLMSVVINTSYTLIGSRLYTASAIRLGTLYRLFMASCIIFISLGLTRLMGYSPGWIIRPGRVLLIIAVSISIYGVYNSNQTIITRYSVSIDNLPDQWVDKKIGFIADTHLGAVRNVGLVRKITPMIEAEGVQALLIAGDYYDGPKANDQQLAQALGEISTPYGTYLAPGNHEEYGQLNQYIQYLNEAGVHVLNNQFSTISGLQIIGVNYSSTTSTLGLYSVLESLNIQSSQPTILIKHVPSNTEVIEQFRIDLQVAGHTHEGQVRPGPWIVRKIYGIYAYGMQTIGQSIIITTSGVGTRGPPQRVGTNSEIVIITLVKK